jgi:hypothetical protein
VELNHHCTVHLGSIHIIYALHADQILVVILVTLLLHIHHVLVAANVVLVLSLTIIQMLMNRNILKMVLVLLLAAEGELRTLVQLVSIALPRNVHHDEVLPKLVLVRLVQPHGIMLQLTVVLHNDQARSVLLINAGTAYCEPHQLLLIFVVFSTLMNAVRVPVTVVLCRV